MNLTPDQMEVLKEIPGYVRREILYDWIDGMTTEPATNDYYRGFNFALEILKVNMDNGVI